MAKKEMGKLHAYAKEHGIRFFGKFVTPPLLSTFQVKILSGRGIPSLASGGNDCTVYDDLSTVNNIHPPHISGDLKAHGLRAIYNSK